MLAVHPPHQQVHGLRDFLVHLSTITMGLLIALAVEERDCIWCLPLLLPAKALDCPARHELPRE